MIRTGAVPAALIAVLVLAGAGTAQEISGWAVDADGRPLPNVPVALHRVGGAGGATVAASTTDRDGRFSFRIEGGDSALHFVAMRHDDRLFIGPPARGGAQPITDYRVVADPSAEAGVVASALATPRPLAGGAMTAAQGRPEPATGRLAWVVALLAVAAAAAFLTAAPAYRERQRRTLLLELATVENRLADPGSTATREQAERRRDRLRERLTPRS